jgi:hypothetical protein
MEDIIEWLGDKGFEGNYEDNIYVIFDKDRTGLHIGIFPENYRDKNLAGTIAAETHKTFYNWTHGYLIREYPQTEREMIVLLQDLDIICKKEHVERAEHYESFDRNPKSLNYKPRTRKKPNPGKWNK